eukprot:scaffold32250_cov31-Tisochrysis_lutea.AAC.3
MWDSVGISGWRAAASALGVNFPPVACWASVSHAAARPVCGSPLASTASAKRQVASARRCSRLKCETHTPTTCQSETLAMRRNVPIPGRVSSSASPSSRIKHRRSLNSDGTSDANEFPRYCVAVVCPID